MHASLHPGASCTVSTGVLGLGSETLDAQNPYSLSGLQAKGKLVELSNHHTASRIIQFCVKYGTPAERKFIMEEVKAKIVDLAKSKYGHHLVQKLITVSSKEEVPGTLTAPLMGIIPMHATLHENKCGCDVDMRMHGIPRVVKRHLRLLCHRMRRHEPAHSMV